MKNVCFESKITTKRNIDFPHSKWKITLSGRENLTNANIEKH